MSSRGAEYLFGAYLHPDWDLDYENWEDAVQAFALEADDDTLKGTAREIRSLVESTDSNQRCSEFLKQLDYNGPMLDGHEGWQSRLLSRILQLLEAELLR